ncbi:TetR/AcrR family transcriptional regulator C-terminal domain-containing protein [Promicromonospora thailandica]|uniref:Transcriptional regulator, TetR family n=1 Tax=Promicromonospora thailandica TaxID=765201 RepID=A0A9X2GD70_9MICO|nr:TetR/AcrR family transcriptional regulator C-terminal domain-containing protein [Promicromonospora thailandica]MCP2267071.1 transcriptional regulator, TetR family [Promicromonospora thailandica]BFF16650.1 TetR/AcrR family transcriptional regulator C-terminal domain-containing protein [Promicromonospora thailandica]
MENRQAGTRTTQGRGDATRHRILEATARLCVERQGGDLSVAEIARTAGVFPNQVTYHFGSKDSLLVHAAFLALLHDAERLEKLGAQATDAAAFRRGIARVVLTLPSLPAVARALAAGISRPDLAPVVDRHLQLLFRQSERYVRRLADGRGWATGRPPHVEVRTFWSTALGAMLLARAGVGGTPADLDLASTLTLHE